MVYNPIDAYETRRVEAGTVVEGVIIKIDDGKARDFIKSDVALAKFKNPDEPAVNIVIEYRIDGKSSFIERIFSYQTVDGKTAYHKKSNLGKFKSFYGKVPDVGMKVKLSANADGYFKLLM